MADYTTAITGTTELDNSAVLAYEQQFLLAAADEGVMDQFVTHKLDIGAKSIEMTKYSQIAPATTPLTEDEEVASVALADAQILLTPAEYGAVVTRTNLSSLQSGGKVDVAAARLVGINMGRTLDKLAILAAEASSNVITQDGGAEADLAATKVMGLAFLNKLYNKLARASVPTFQDGLYVAVMHEDVIFDLRTEASAGWMDVAKYANAVSVLRNEVGMCAGFRVVRDNNITINTDAGTSAVDTYHTLCMGYNALGKAVSQVPQLTIRGPFDKLGRFVHIGWKGCLVYGIVDTDALWVGTTASSVGTNA